jgi:phosphoribosylformylglycinamidine synthase
MLVRAVKGCYDASIGFGTPFISGKDSLNNEYRMGEQRIPVLPTLLISAVGIIDNASETIDMSLKDADNLLYQIGITHNELAGSHYAEVVEGAIFEHLFPETSVPQVDISTARTRMKVLGAAIRKGMVRACHDLSEGGLAVAVAEMSVAGLLGVSIDVGRVVHKLDGNQGVLRPHGINTLLLFSESASRFVVEIAPGQRDMFEAYLREHGVEDFACIGEVTDTGRFVMHNGQQVLIDIPVATLQMAWKGEESLVPGAEQHEVSVVMREEER